SVRHLQVRFPYVPGSSRSGIWLLCRVLEFHISPLEFHTSPILASIPRVVHQERGRAEVLCSARTSQTAITWLACAKRSVSSPRLWFGGDQKSFFSPPPAPRDYERNRLIA